jgi:MFS family permease
MPNKSNDRLNKGVITLGWVSFLTDVASEMIYPLLPDFLTRILGASPGALGLIEGVAESTASLTKMFSGWWSDRLRRRKPLVVAGYAIATAVRPLVAFATTWAQVLAIRFADRFGKGVRTSPRDALIAGLVPPERRGRAFGLQRAMDNAGALVGPLLAAALLKFWIQKERTVFLLAFLPGMAAVLLLIWKVPEAARPVPRAEVALPSTEDRFPPLFWPAIGVFVLFALANSTDAFLLLRARQAGIELWQLPLLWGFFNGAKAAAGVPGGALADRIGRIPTVALGWGIYALAYVGFAFVASPIAVWGLFAFYALFFALTEGAERALIADLVPEHLRGRAFGVFHASIGLAALPSSLLFGLLWSSLGPRVAFAIGAGFALFALAALLLLRSKMRPWAARP